MTAYAKIPLFSTKSEKDVLSACPSFVSPREKQEDLKSKTT
jgi:hypothetical protein